MIAAQIRERYAPNQCIKRKKKKKLNKYALKEVSWLNKDYILM